MGIGKQGTLDADCIVHEWGGSNPPQQPKGTIYDKE
jgi:hypothetical protein